MEDTVLYPINNNHLFPSLSLSLSLSPSQCAELQGFVRPLLELLNGLKGGRFDRGKHHSPTLVCDAAAVLI